MEFRILGPLEAIAEGRALTLGGSRQRALLALLLTRANEVVSTDRLIDELWGAQPPKTAANALQYHVSQLRRTLAPGGTIVTRGPGYLIRVEPHELDLFLFERLVTDAQRSSPEVAAGLLRDALRLWRGPALADVAHESFAQTEILRLDELRLSALDLRLEADLALGRHGELVGELELLVREHPLRERLRAQLMRALYGCGRQAEALDVYRETRRLLVDELGIEPSAALRELETAILRQDASSDAREPPRGRRASARSWCSPTTRSVSTSCSRSPSHSRENPARDLILARLLQRRRSRGDERRARRTPRRPRASAASRPASPPSRRPSPETDAARLAIEHDVDLVLVDASPRLLESGRPDQDLAALLEAAPCDVAVLVGHRRCRARADRGAVRRRRARLVGD